MNNLNNTVYSVEQSGIKPGQTGINEQNTGKSFIDNKPMIQGLVRSILKV